MIASAISPTEEAILTEGIAYIGRNAFSGCNKLHQMVLPISIEEIEDSALKTVVTSNQSHYQWH